MMAESASHLEPHQPPSNMRLLPFPFYDVVSDSRFREGGPPNGPHTTQPSQTPNAGPANPRGPTLPQVMQDVSPPNMRLLPFLFYIVVPNNQLRVVSLLMYHIQHNQLRSHMQAQQTREDVPLPQVMLDNPRSRMRAQRVVGLEDGPICGPND